MAKSIKFNYMIRDILLLKKDITENQITYCLGCAGEVAGRDSRVESMFKYYYVHGWDEKIGTQGSGLPGWYKGMPVGDAWNIWLNINRGKMCFDCSGLIDWAIGYKGIHKYSSYDFGNMPKNSSIKKGVAGSVLYKPGHVGIDIGYGMCVEIGQYNDTIQLNNIYDRSFKSSHLIPEVDYTGANGR